MAAVVAGAVVALVAVAVCVGVLTRPSGPASSGSGTAQSRAAAPVLGAAGGALSAGAGQEAGSSVAAPAPAPTTAAGATAGPNQPAPTPPTATVVPGVAPKVIKQGTVALGVGKGKVDSTVAALTTMAAGQGGFVTRSQTTESSDDPAASVVLRVPGAAFEDTVARVRSLGKVTSQTTSGEDVTSQYVDLQARISALQASRERYLSILTRASSIGDILAVQQQIDSLQSQLEQLQGQLQVMTDQTTYATLEVDVTQLGAPPPAPRPAPVADTGWRHAWHDAWSVFVGGLQAILAASGAILLALLCLGGALGAALVGRRVYRRRTGAPSEPPVVVG
ncbi:MAG TPA: DUF4349 domain-containing protein [Acidimicrobiales bacterium]|nr:DUF4349 domain-containing protein [Acidimicrobiales bacterium]